MRTLLLTLALLAAYPSSSTAGWGPSGCPTVGGPRSGWFQHQGVYYYYVNGTQVAGYNPTTKEYRRYDRATDHWFAPETPPWHKTANCNCSPCTCNPCRCQSPGGDFHFGVDGTQLHKGNGNHYRLNGKDVTREEALAAVKLADDSGLPFVTFIGPNREKLYKAFLATPEAQKCRVNSYEAADWQVEPGFVRTGSPTIYVQNAKGGVLYRTDVEPPLDELRHEVRKAQPDYDASLDPNGSVDYLAALKKLPLYVWGLIGGAALLLFNKRKA